MYNLLVFNPTSLLHSKQALVGVVCAPIPLPLFLGSCMSGYHRVEGERRRDWDEISALYD